MNGTKIGLRIITAGWLLLVAAISFGQTEIHTLIELHQVRDDLAEDYVLMNDIDASPTADWNELVDAGVWNDATDYALVPVGLAENGEIPRVEHDGKAYYVLQNSGPGHGGAVEPGDNDYWWETELPAGHKFGWEPINDFTGTFDGGGHAVTEVYINRPEVSETNGRGGYRVGFWGSIGACVIHDLRILDVDITAYTRSGAFYASASNAHIKRCEVSGTIRGWASTGGFTSGQWAGTIVEDCVAHVTVIRREGSTSASLAGFAGHARMTSFYRCYATGEMLREEGGTFTTSRGFLSDWHLGSYEVRNCFWDVDSSGQTSSPQGTGKTTEELYIRSTFTDLRTLGLGRKKSGTASATEGSTSVTGTGTEFTAEFSAGEMIRLHHGIEEAEYREIESIAGDTALTVTEPWGKTHNGVDVFNVAESDKWDLGKFPSELKGYLFLSGQESPAWYIYEPPVGTVFTFY